LLRIDWGADERQACIDYLNFDRVTTDDGKERTIPDPFDGNAPEQIDKKIRGLLYILAQHPSYQLR
jgi:hypothetical protein